MCEQNNFIDRNGAPINFINQNFNNGDDNGFNRPNNRRGGPDYVDRITLSYLNRQGGQIYDDNDDDDEDD